MNTRVFLITAKTNLHVGDEGGAEFSIIDKAIQRDTLTGLPCINSSSLKGALNEYCTRETSMSPEVRTRIFGSDKDSNKSSGKKGEAIFFDAQILLLPQQESDVPYSLVTTQSILDRMAQRIKLAGGSFDSSKIPAHKNPLLADAAFKEACSDENLPIIARNVLDSGGISKHLWYEQVIPAETVFYTVIREKGDDLKEALSGKVIQIGANATIGYGYCLFELI